MGIFSKRNHAPDLNIEQRGLSPDTEAAFAAGETSECTASPNSALNLSYVYSAMYLISSSLAQLPLKVLKREEDNVKAAPEHPMSSLISFRFDEFQSSYKWRETEQFRCLGWGNAYTEISRRGPRPELKNHAPWLVTLQKNLNNGTYYYLVSSDDGEPAYAVDPEDMIHIKDISYNSKMGVSRIKQNAPAIEWGLAMQNYGSSFFGSNGRPTGAVSPKNELNDESWQRFKKMFKNAGSSFTSNSNRTMLLPAELSYQSFTIPPEDMQYLESRSFSRTEVASMFNVPPHMIGALENATFSNISEQVVQYVKYTIMPWVKLWEQELNYKLFTTSELKAGYYVKFNLAGLLRGTPKDRAEFYKIMVDIGAYTRQEVRALEDMNPIDGLDKPVISQNIKSVEMMDAEAVIKSKEASNGNGNENI
ncbi:MAG: phage portal protein [Vibrio litoralis]|uniref:phage portal protein n=1 Tax=Vibrio litoralis TaxID=335972 RepID=UPI003F958937